MSFFLSKLKLSFLAYKVLDSPILLSSSILLKKKKFNFKWEIVLHFCLFFIMDFLLFGNSESKFVELDFSLMDLRGEDNSEFNKGWGVFKISSNFSSF